MGAKSLRDVSRSAGQETVFHLRGLPHPQDAAILRHS